MYERVLDTPRLLCWYSGETGFPHPVLARARTMLSEHYATELGEAFVTAGLCLYRDGRDSVAWHGDRIGRGARETTMVAILSVGSQRYLTLRPRRDAGPDVPEGSGSGNPGASDRGSRRSVRVPSGHGDLLVMGGSCQRTWEHAIPKTSQSVGPRISIQFRPAGVA
jgi:alkylated DNA repair dioxygenase AlkB